jgi:hypothetical protein
MALAVDEGGDGWLLGVRRGHPSSLTLHLDDDVISSFGGSKSAPRYWFAYGSTGAQFESWSTDTDGAGLNGLVYHVADGTDDVVFDGNAIVPIGQLVCFEDDCTSYVYSSADNVIALVLDESTKITFDNSGNLVTWGMNLRATDSKRLGVGSNDDCYFQHVPGEESRFACSGAVNWHVDEGGSPTIFDKDVRLETHLQYTGAKAGLTNSSANSFVRVAVDSGGHSGGKVFYSVHAANAADTEIQAINGELGFACVNIGGTETCTLAEGFPVQPEVSPTGSISATFDYTSTVDGTVDIRVTPVSAGLSDVDLLMIHYLVILDHANTITDL